jgi:hypothetical protein
MTIGGQDADSGPRNSGRRLLQRLAILPAISSWRAASVVITE